MQKAKIVATIGPASQTPQGLQGLIEAGMDVARLNFSHGHHAFHYETIRNLKQFSQKLALPIAILQDLQGIKIRTGRLKDAKPVTLAVGQRFTISTNPVIGDETGVSTSYEALSQDVQPGDRILLSDGLIELRALRTTTSDIECEVLVGGTLAENQGINLPGVNISAAGLTQKDLEDLAFGLEHGVDYIALSFIRSAQDVIELREKLAQKGHETPIIAKLEKPSAIESLDAIMEVCDGLMVARGDLGVEMSPERVPVIQKQVIEKANRKGKIVITATQMLESMIYNPQPTRAEASDVANAVFDGSDALMLSGETAVGRYPVQAVQMMCKIITEAEKVKIPGPPDLSLGPEMVSFPEAVCEAAAHASKAIRARAIVAFTQTGSTARLISKYRPSTDIFGVTPHIEILNRLSLYWGVTPLIMPSIRNVDELIQNLEKLLLEKKLVEKDDNLVILTGAPIVEKGHTSLMKLHQVKGT